MMKAAENAAAVGDGNSKIGDVANGAGTKADDASVKGIALGIKGIVDAAGNGDHAGAAAGDATNPIAAAIGQAGQDGAAFNNNNMKKDDKIAAAIVLRGLAKDGKFAATDADAGAKDGKKGDAVTSVVQEVNKWLEEMMKAAEKAADAGDGNSKIGDVAHGAAGTKADDASVKGIALGIKGIVDAAGKASGEDGGGGALKGVKEATDKNNADAGKLFATSGGGRAGAADVGKASDAVSAVSGKQIIKAIVDAAEKGGGGHAGAAAGDATNPIAAAIGQANQAGAAFVDNNMKKDDKIAAAIVLRGLAKDEKFAATDENGAKSAKSVIESARKLTNG
ncbi:variable large family protein [Borreliella burgdorferi]|uniref:variable large family protein n=1 Tax=Borreliella burgdorferi TaxID=139 RepID=UPI003AA7D9F4